MGEIRAAAVKGSWYPSSPERLGREIDEYISDVDAPPGPPPCAIIAPHAGLLYSGRVAAFAYQRVRAARYAAVVLVGPSHFVGFIGVSIWPTGSWETPFGAVPIAEKLTERIASGLPERFDHRSAHAREHSLELQMPFVARVLPGVPIVPVLMGHQERSTAFMLGDAVGEAVAELEGDPVLLIASSDLSHYQDASTAAAMDGTVLRHVERLDADGLMQALEREPHHACGGGPMVAVMRAATRLGASRAEVLKYGDSGDVTGDKSSVVGYMAAAIWA